MGLKLKKAMAKTSAAVLRKLRAKTGSFFIFLRFIAKRIRKKAVANNGIFSKILVCRANSRLFERAVKRLFRKEKLAGFVSSSSFKKFFKFKKLCRRSKIIRGEMKNKNAPKLPAVNLTVFLNPHFCLAEAKIK